jgi:hypothetical protein
MTEISEERVLCAISKIEMEAEYSSRTMITTTKLHDVTIQKNVLADTAPEFCASFVE